MTRVTRYLLPGLRTDIFSLQQPSETPSCFGQFQLQRNIAADLCLWGFAVSGIYVWLPKLEFYRPGGTNPLTEQAHLAFLGFESIWKYGVIDIVAGAAFDTALALDALVGIYFELISRLGFRSLPVRKSFKFADVAHRRRNFQWIGLFFGLRIAFRRRCRVPPPGAEYEGVTYSPNLIGCFG